MEKAYRIVSKVEPPLISFSDLVCPKAAYTLIRDDGRVIRASLPRRSDWEVGIVVMIEEGLIRASLIE